MLKLSEIEKVSQTVGDGGRSPFADCLGMPWGLPAGALTMWRSSASHVFVTRNDEVPADARYLKAIPAGWRDRNQLHAVADLAGQLRSSGAPVVTMLPSVQGSIIETVATRWGDYHVMLVAGAAGQQIEAQELSPAQAVAWGAALATFHACGMPQDGLPTAFGRLSTAGAVFADDPPLVAAVGDLIDQLSTLSADSASFGIVHGDFELDNLAWAGDVPTAFDLDEAQYSWFADDVAQATRDLRQPPAGATPTSQRLLGQFINGYRTVRPFTEEQLSQLSLLAAARAADNLIGLHVVADSGTGSSDPDWLRHLHRKVTGYLGRQREIVLTFTGRSSVSPA